LQVSRLELDSTNKKNEEPGLIGKFLHRGESKAGTAQAQISAKGDYLDEPTLCARLFATSGYQILCKPKKKADHTGVDEADLSGLN
jgi:hypothetical protein